MSITPFTIKIKGPDGHEYELKGTTKTSKIPSDLDSVLRLRARGDVHLYGVATSNDEMTALRAGGKLKSLTLLEGGRFQEVVTLSTGEEKYWGPLLHRVKAGGHNVQPGKYIEFLQAMIDEDAEFAKFKLQIEHFRKQNRRRLITGVLTAVIAVALACILPFAR